MAFEIRRIVNHSKFDNVDDDIEYAKDFQQEHFMSWVNCC
jgi:hypothetical protein